MGGAAFSTRHAVEHDAPRQARRASRIVSRTCGGPGVSVGSMGVPDRFSAASCHPPSAFGRECRDSSAVEQGPEDATSARVRSAPLLRIAYSRGGRTENHEPPRRWSGFRSPFAVAATRLVARTASAIGSRPFSGQAWGSRNSQDDGTVQRGRTGERRFHQRDLPPPDGSEFSVRFRPPRTALPTGRCSPSAFVANGGFPSSRTGEIRC